MFELLCNFLIVLLCQASTKEQYAEGVETGPADMLQASDEKHGEVRTDGLEEDFLSDQVLTLAILEKSTLRCTSGKLTAEPETTVSSKLEPLELSTKSNDKALINGKMGYSELSNKDLLKDGESGSSKLTGSSSFGTRNQDRVLKMVGYLVPILKCLCLETSAIWILLKFCY